MGSLLKQIELKERWTRVAFCYPGYLKGGHMNIKKEIEKLLNSPVTAYEIESKTGVDRSVITRLRNGERSVEKLTVQTAQKLLNFIENKW